MAVVAGGLMAQAVLLLWLLSGALIAAEPLRTITPEQMIEWEPHAFAELTQYQLTTHRGRTAVEALCAPGSASGLFYLGEIDLEATPIIEWDWAIAMTFDDIDETTRSGDDYPARLYVVDDRRPWLWQTRAVNYVWSSVQPRRSVWPNAYQQRAIMIAVQSGLPEEPGAWVTQRRNIRQDFQVQHERDLRRINSLAIMTDCDDAGQPAQAWYGEIRFYAEP